MNIAKSIITVATSFVFSTAMASEKSPKENSDWFLIASSQDNTRSYSGKAGSLEITNTKNGSQVAIIIGQIEDKTNNTLQYNKWYVSVDDCKKESGKMALLDISGEYIDSIDFVLGGNNIASGIADVICGAYDIRQKEIEGKGL
ncbi:hypothetical protein [Pseudomonas xionganensis]|uniref:Uncharacterized protein n=1 Tax=Pseudomonas xionganensis TaxID=2654845 RepID=A0A6I4KZY1_9PSED|nr:hypothetical protein [Pseudomonas xionganensis]MVW77301.1 hypothetical protein [Pseudomonas xionganensis]